MDGLNAYRFSAFQPLDTLTAWFQVADFTINSIAACSRIQKAKSTFNI